MRKIQSWQETVKTGAIIVLPALVGSFMDWLFQISPAGTFLGAGLSVYELTARILGRSIDGATQYCYPDKFAGYQDFEELDSDDSGH